MAQDVIELLSNLETSAAPSIVESLGWLHDSTPDQLERHYAKLTARHAELQALLATRLGRPCRYLPRDAAWFESWYPEAFAAAAWLQDENYVCLAAEHADKEAPAAIVMTRLTPQEIEERAG